MVLRYSLRRNFREGKHCLEYTIVDVLREKVRSRPEADINRIRRRRIAASLTRHPPGRRAAAGTRKGDLFSFAVPGLR